ncbi:MAG: N-acetyltransferase [Clostridiales bacterium]|nr:N-acetyltransferase [Clostridiales bacterium]
MNIIIRPEQPSDYQETIELTRAAFWNIYRPGCDEHFLLHRLRKDDCFIPELSFVAIAPLPEGGSRQCRQGGAPTGAVRHLPQEGRLVGHIACARTHIEGDGGARHEMLTFGPLSVLPEYQKTGVGTLLIQRVFAEAPALGFGAVLICGSPFYYCRHGFKGSKAFGIRDANGDYPFAQLAIELIPGALSGKAGRWVLPKVYEEEDPAALDAFDAAFPPWEKKTLPIQNAFLLAVSATIRED